MHSHDQLLLEVTNCSLEVQFGVGSPAEDISPAAISQITIHRLQPQHGWAFSLLVRSEQLWLIRWNTHRGCWVGFFQLPH